MHQAADSTGQKQKYHVEPITLLKERERQKDRASREGHREGRRETKREGGRERQQSLRKRDRWGSK